MTDDRPKTAYELAMERLAKKDRETGTETRPLTDEQKAAVAEARQVYQARVAEREILHRSALAKATSAEEVEGLNLALRRDLDRLATDRDVESSRPSFLRKSIRTERRESLSVERPTHTFVDRAEFSVEFKEGSASSKRISLSTSPKNLSPLRDDSNRVAPDEASPFGAGGPPQ